MIRFKEAFSLAELMIVLLIMTIILAATMPILSKRAKVKAAANTTISLPTKNEGDSCTLGSVAIGSDGSLLTCQGGTYKKPPSASGSGQALYIYGYPSTSSPTVNSCPSGWISAGIGSGTMTYDSHYDNLWYSLVNSCYKCS